MGGLRASWWSWTGEDQARRSPGRHRGRPRRRCKELYRAPGPQLGPHRAVRGRTRNRVSPLRRDAGRADRTAQERGLQRRLPARARAGHTARGLRGGRPRSGPGRAGRARGGAVGRRTRARSGWYAHRVPRPAGVRWSPGRALRADNLMDETRELLVDWPAEDVLRLRLNRPDRLNAINTPLVEALNTAFDGVDARAVVLDSSTPRAFCAGADLDLEDAERARVSDLLYALYEKMVRLPIPIVVAINGNAVGGGAQLAIAGDLRVAGPLAILRVAGPGHGLAVAAWGLPSLVGRGPGPGLWAPRAGGG